MQEQLNVNATPIRSSAEWVESQNMRGALPRRVGALSGFVGSLGIIAIVTLIVAITGNDLFTAPRVIASVIYGEEVSGFFPVVVGTGIHLITGTVLGLVFAIIMPPIYRTMWMVAGLIFGFLAFIVSALVVLPLIDPVVMASEANYFVLLVAHMVYGFALGIVGSTYGLWWDLPERFRK